MTQEGSPLSRRLGAEALGSFLLFVTVIGSGIMAEALSSGNNGIALLGNTIATGAVLFVLITMLGPISGAHFNPAVSAVMALRRELPALSLMLAVSVTSVLFGNASGGANAAMKAFPSLR